VASVLMLLARTRIERCARTSGSAKALAVAGVVFVAQLIAIAHVHPGMLVRAICDGRRVASSEICPLCSLHVHTPSSTTATFQVIVPFLSEAFVATALRSRLLCSGKPQLFGRAPPASA
jgi:hypothetical protein